MAAKPHGAMLQFQFKQCCSRSPSEQDYESQQTFIVHRGEGVTQLPMAGDEKMYRDRTNAANAAPPGSKERYDHLLTAADAASNSEQRNETLLMAASAAPSSKERYDALTRAIDAVRDGLQSSGEMAVAHLIYAALDHTSDGITHADQKLQKAYSYLTSIDYYERGRTLCREVCDWVSHNPIKAVLMVIGLGGTMYKARTLKQLLESYARGYIDWSRTTWRLWRFMGFVLLMIARLGVSTVVPPTSPAFAVIIQMATPDAEKWTAMPFFLLSSTVAGGFPWLMDKLLEPCFHEDFRFTFLMKWLTEVWPLTCWTAPAMMKVFETANGGETGACLAVIVAHAAPFMGAQTTLMQRYFLPHPLDTIISQPFGMSEDLVSMALAEAGTDTRLASISLSVLVIGFNLARYLYFSKCADLGALLIAVLNLGVGVFFALWVVPELLGSVSGHLGLATVSLQLFVQVLLVPFVSRCCLPRAGVSTRSDVDGRVAMPKG